MCAKWWTLSSQYKSIVCCCRKETQRHTGLHQDGITSTDKSSLYPTWHLWGHTWNTVLFWSLLWKKMWTGCRGSRGGPQRGTEDWEACHVRKGSKNWLCSALRKEALWETLSTCFSMWSVLMKKIETPFLRGVTWKRKEVMVWIILEETTIRQKRKHFHRIISAGRWQIPQHGCF